MLRRLLVAAIAADLLILLVGFILDSQDLLSVENRFTGLEDALPKLLPIRLRAGLWLATYALLLAAYVGLLCRWSFARPAYLVVWAVSFLLVATGPEQALNSLGGDLTLLSGFAGGFLICLIYFTPLANEFRRGAN